VEVGKLFEQAPIAVQDEKAYAQLHAVIDAAFAPSDVEVLLSKVTRAKLPVRNFEEVIRRGYLGKDALAVYQGLPVSDQALTREHYLKLVEKVSAELRTRYFKAYAYY
jgi:hypothetical protein